MGRNWFLNNIYDENAIIEIIKFYDYQCPYCKQVQSSLEAVKNSYSDEITIKYAHFPLEIHPHAKASAIAAECARIQNSFQEFNKILFDNQENIDSISFLQVAEESGVKNLTNFNQCIESQETSEIVESGMALANQLSINLIPSFLINGTLVAGALSEEQLNNYIDEALKAAKWRPVEHW